MEKTNPVVTVVVSAYTGERFGDLEELFHSLAKQTYYNFEIIVVVEKSKKLFRNLHDHINEKGYINTRLMFNSGPEGLSSARNIGVEHARGEIIAFIDDDARASPDWLAEIVKTFSNNNNTIGVTGPITPIWENESMDWFPEELYWIFACTGRDDRRVKAVRNGYGTNMSFRKDAFERCGLFLVQLGAKGGGQTGKHELVGEDTEFSLRVSKQTGGNIIYAPGVLVHHRVYRYRLNQGFVARRAFWEGYTKAILKKIASKEHSTTLSTEYSLLIKILTKLIPLTIIGLVLRPVFSLKRLMVIVTVLACIAFGYFRGSFYTVESKRVIA